MGGRGQDRRTFACEKEIEIKGEARPHAIPLLHVYGAKDEHIDHHAALQQWLQRPLVRVIIIGMVRPCQEDLSEQRRHGERPRRLIIGTRGPQPEAFGVVRDLIGAELGDEPHDERRHGGRQEEPGYASEGRLRDAAQGALDVAGLGLADGLQGADVARDEGEDGDADAAVDEDADDGPLQQAWCVVGEGTCVGVEEDCIEGSGEMGDDDGDGCETTEALC